MDRLAPLKPERTALAALQHNPVGILVRKRVHGTGHRNTLRLERQPLRPFSRLINRGGQGFPPHSRFCLRPYPRSAQELPARCAPSLSLSLLKSCHERRLCQRWSAQPRCRQATPSAAAPAALRCWRRCAGLRPPLFRGLRSVSTIRLILEREDGGPGGDGSARAVVAKAARGIASWGCLGNKSLWTDEAHCGSPQCATPPMPSPFRPQKNGRYRGSHRLHQEKQRLWPTRNTLWMSQCLGGRSGSFAILAVDFLSDPGQVLITTQHVRYLFAQQNRADSLPERLAMVGMVDVKSKSC